MKWRRNSSTQPSIAAYTMMMYEASLLRVVTAQGCVANSVPDVVCYSIARPCYNLRLSPEQHQEGATSISSCVNSQKKCCGPLLACYS
jgi:hypothetical protein